MRSLTWRYFDFWLFGVVVFLVIFGIAMIRSAVAGSITDVAIVNRQIIFAGLGLVVIIAATLIDYHYWASLVRPMYLATLILLLVVFVVGKVSYGAQRWLETGLVDIQPSELGKLVMILTLADYFARTEDQDHDLKWVFRSLLITLAMVVWIFLQPNLSMTIVIMVLWFAMLWISGLKLKYFALLGILAIVLGTAAFPFLENYQKGRILNYLMPQTDTTAKHGDTYNVDQALISIGSGGWFGMGYGHGTQVQLRFLKVRHTDFIFSAMAEEFGFVGTSIIIILLLFVVLRCLRAARLASDRFGSLICYGFGVLMFFQTSVNIGVNLNVIPVTGLTLPFISYGGNSLLSLLFGIGIVESVIMRHKPLDF